MKAMTKSLTSQSSLTPVISAALEAFDVFTVQRVAEGVAHPMLSSIEIFFCCGP